MFRRILILSTLLLSACGQAPVAPTAVVATQGEPAAMALSTETRRLFHAIFDGFDQDRNGKWEPKDFDLPEDRFLNLFGKTDSDDDHVVTRKEYYSPDRHEAMVIRCLARAKVSQKGAGGKVNLDKAVFILDVYLKPYLNQKDRRDFIAGAFKRADKNDDGVLSQAELAHAYAILEAAADEKAIEKKVNRSIGQPEK